LLRILASALALIALAGSGDAPATAENEKIAAMVTLTDGFTFAPRQVTVHVGETVEWRNLSPFPHTVTDDPAAAGQKDDATLPRGAAAFGSGTMQSGETWRMAFAAPGTYRYFCRLHEGIGMIGEITVLPAR